MQRPVENDKRIITLHETELLSATVAAHVPPGGRVVVAEPTSADVLAAVAAAGARWVDAGRDHRFRIDAAGWRTALGVAAPALVVLGAPDEPTGTLPSPERVREALAAGAIVLLDRRFARRPRDAARMAALVSALRDRRGLVVIPSRGRGLWVRVPGVPSLEIARLAGHPLVVGAATWTWRDAVRVTPPEPRDLEGLLAALRRAQ